MKYKNMKKVYYSNSQEYEKTYNDRFNNEETMHFDFDIFRQPAFLVWTKEIGSLISKILKNDKLVWKAVENLPIEAIGQFQQKSLIEEIKLTNEIEGVASTRKEIIEAFNAVANKKNKETRFYGIVNKYVMLMDQNTSITSCKDIRNIYDELVLDEVILENPENKPDGVYFRKNEVFVEKNSKIIHSGVMPEATIIEYLDKGIKLINDNEIDSLVSMAVFHYLFGYVHPFYDGNGRMSRYISSALLSKDLFFLVGFNLSYVIKNHIGEYYKAFALTNDAKNCGDLTPFVTTFLEFVVEATEELLMDLSEKDEKYKRYETILSADESLKKLNKEFIPLLLANSLFGIKGISIEEIATAINVNNMTVRNYFKALDKAMILVSKEGHKNLYDINLNYLEELYNE
ncbi:MAG: Fic family protein [Anaerovoracaceae bacterium]